MNEQDAAAMLRRASKYLRDNCGRTETEAPRRILTTASRCIGTGNEVNLDDIYIRRGYPEGSPARIAKAIREAA